MTHTARAQHSRARSRARRAHNTLMRRDGRAHLPEPWPPAPTQCARSQCRRLKSPCLRRSDRPDRTMEGANGRTVDGRTGGSSRGRPREADSGRESVVGGCCSGFPHCAIAIAIPASSRGRPPARQMRKICLDLQFPIGAVGTFCTWRGGGDDKVYRHLREGSTDAARHNARDNVCNTPLRFPLRFSNRLPLGLVLGFEGSVEVLALWSPL